MRRPLPEKICPRCDRPFTWRKRWARCWDEVVYCSAACRGARPKRPVPPAREA